MHIYTHRCSLRKQLYSLETVPCPAACHHICVRSYHCHWSGSASGSGFDPLTCFRRRCWWGHLVTENEYKTIFTQQARESWQQSCGQMNRYLQVVGDSEPQQSHEQKQYHPQVALLETGENISLKLRANIGLLYTDDDWELPVQLGSSLTTQQQRPFLENFSKSNLNYP